MKIEIFDKIFLVPLWILFPVLTVTLLFWWTGYLFNLTGQLPGIVLSGFILGLIVCLLSIKGWLNKAYQHNTVLLIILYLFYMTGIFGFFMGVPVFNIIPGILAAIYFSRKTILLNNKADNYKNIINIIQLIMAAGLLFISTASAFIALSDAYTGENIKGMLGLSFDVTSEMIWFIIITGGLALLITQYLSIKVIEILTLRVLPPSK